MRIYICDACRAGGKQVEARWKLTLKKGFEKLPLDVCDLHKKSVKTYEQALGCLMKDAPQGAPFQA